jgi:hypothetical protein
MARQVYRREGPENWCRRDEGAVLPIGAIEVAGFNSIDGVCEHDIYAVGFGGEIWRCVYRRWYQVKSPTRAILNCVRVVRKELIYAAGHKGVLLRGNGDGWEQVVQKETTDDLWGMEWFNETLYVCSDKAIYCVNEDGEFKAIELGHIKTSGHLHANDGVMWSFGGKHVAWTENGLDWNDATP